MIRVPICRYGLADARHHDMRRAKSCWNSVRQRLTSVRGS
ncbi:MAG: hypothetical protein RLZZ536_2546 [Planctomycetota bacterium]